MIAIDLLYLEMVIGGTFSTCSANQRALCILLIILD